MPISSDFPDTNVDFDSNCSVITTDRHSSSSTDSDDLCNRNRNENNAARRSSRLHLRSGSITSDIDEPYIDQTEYYDELEEEHLLETLRECFEAGGEGKSEGKEGLNMEEFKQAMHKTVGKNQTNDDLEILFMKIDANCDGCVEWEEFVTYYLLECKEIELMKIMLQEHAFPQEMREIDSKHRDQIVKIELYPMLIKTSAATGRLNKKNGKYITLSSDGTVGIWNIHMKKPVYHSAIHIANRNARPYFTDMVVMVNVNMVAIASNLRDVVFHDLTGDSFKIRYKIVGFDDCIMSMHYWTNMNNLNEAILMLGDMSGSVIALKYSYALRTGAYGTTSHKKVPKRINAQTLVKGLVQGIRMISFLHVLHDWANKVRYLPDTDSVIASSQSEETSLFLGDFSCKRSHLFFSINKGTLCFDYSHSNNIIVTGGLDHAVRVWNPYVNTKATAVFKRHVKPVSHVIIDEKTAQVISVDKGRNINVFDLRDQICVQSISGQSIHLGPFFITAVFYNTEMRTILLAAHNFVLFQRREDEKQVAETFSHDHPVVMALYTPVFDSIVSACQNSVVSIWNINTGCKIMQFINAHYRVERGFQIPVEITAMCFCHNDRRIVTGATDGTIHVWNFNNGSRLQDFQLPDQSRVTSIVCSRRHFYVTGWGRKVQVYVDNAEEDQRKAWGNYHDNDILSIAYLPPNLIATGAYNGDIIIWSRDMGHALYRLNASECTHIMRAVPLAYRKFKSIHSVFRRPGGKMESLGRKIGFGRKKVRVTEDKYTHPLIQALDTGSFSAEKQAQYGRNKYDEVCKNYESAVEKILFLQTRDVHQKHIAVVVTSGAEGWVRFWSIYYEGGLLGQFNACHHVGESVLAMKCDKDERFLFTGDSEGYVKVWDIKHYCAGATRMSESDENVHNEDLLKMFSFYRVDTYEEMKTGTSLATRLKAVFHQRPPPMSSDPQNTVKFPTLLNSFRAHLLSVHSIDYVTERDIIVTASGDCSVRLWTRNGVYIGTFGKAWPTLPKVVTTDYLIRTCNIPAELKRVASTTTLRVLNAGETPFWQSAYTSVQNRRLLQRSVEFKKRAREVIIQEGVELPEEEETVVSEHILGKFYQSRQRHRMLPSLPKFREVGGSVGIFHTLGLSNLTPTDGMVCEMKETRAKNFGDTNLPLASRANKKAPNLSPALLLYSGLSSRPKTDKPVKCAGKIHKMIEEMHANQENPQKKERQTTERKVKLAFQQITKTLHEGKRQSAQQGRQKTMQTIAEGKVF